MNYAHIWNEILSDKNWIQIPTVWLDNKPQSALLFRTHRHHDPLQGRASEIVHASTMPFIGTSMNRLNSQKFYNDAPEPFNFITVYTAQPGQKFYTDETLEYVRDGRQADEGVPIENISTFDPLKHFETDAKGNPVVGTYLVFLPRDMKSFSSATDITKVKILPIDSRIGNLLHAALKQAVTFPAPEPQRNPL